MKNRTFVIVVMAILYSLSANAKSLPDNVCDNCGDTQKTFFDKYISSKNGLSKFNTEAVYSGSCRWSGSYDSEVEHHAGFFFYQVSDSEMIAFKGRLSYFSAVNPYSDYTPEKARQLWFLRPNDLILESYDDYSFFDANPGGDPKNQLNYWFRQDSEVTTRLYVIVQQGYWDLGVCELNQNPNPNPNQKPQIP